MTTERIAVLLVNLGTPQAPTPQALKTYLAEFLGDRRIVGLPRWLWLPILHGIILLVRPAKSAKKYRRIWLAEGSPLLFYTRKLAQGLQSELEKDQTSSFSVYYAMRYGQPSIQAVLDRIRDSGLKKVLLLPLFPQYSTTTTASILDQVDAWHRCNAKMLDIDYIHDYHQNDGYIETLSASIEESWQRNGRSEKLLMSFHGIPVSVVKRGDPYEDQCLQTAEKLASRLKLTPKSYMVTFQSRFGSAKWLQPATLATLVDFAQQGISSVDIVCPGFAADCLETLEEINMECRDSFLQAGGKSMHYIHCLNVRPDWIAALKSLVIHYCK